MPASTTFQSTRFGALEVPGEAVLEFPSGLIGLPDRSWTLLPAGQASAFRWLHSLERPAMALPVCEPWAFFPGYEIELSDADTERMGAEDPADVRVLVTVRATAELAGFSANLRAPILICRGRGHQLINEAPDAPVRASLQLDRLAGLAA